MTFMPKPSPRRAIAWPMRPQPTIPSVIPVVSPPIMCVGYHGTHSPSRTWRSPSLMRRAMPSSSAKAMSAVASVSTPGVLPTAMPRRAASSRSMLSVPTARLATALTLGAASKSSASTFSVMIVSSASASAALEQDVARRRRVVVPEVDVVLGLQPFQRRERERARDEDLSHSRHHAD